jgi:DNA-binding CsgD family transcriptional regulator
MVGRGEEQAALTALTALAAGDPGGAIAVVGDPGAGKSALLDWALAQAGANRMATVRIAGIQGDGAAPCAGIAQLRARLTDLPGDLPPTAAATLHAALDGGDADPPPRLALGVALTALLGLASEPRPLLIAVDDAQWLDAESLEALLFASRRLLEDPLALLLATRTEAPRALVESGFELLEIGDLGRRDAELLVRHTAATATDSVVRAIAAAGGGNPLALIELARSLSPDQLSGQQPLPEPLRAGGTAEAPFRARLAALPASVQGALTVVAAESSGRADLVDAALEVLDVSGEALRTAEAAGLIVRSGPAIDFVHPLCRAAAYDVADARWRRAVHHALAAAHAAAGDPIVRAEHLAKAAEEPDEQLAALIEQAAELARARAAPSVAAKLALQAAELSPTGAERVRRVLVAVELLPDTAHAALAPPAIVAALPYATPEQRVALVRAHATSLVRLGRFEQARELALEESARIAESDPAAAGQLILTATARHVVSGTYADELADAERALVLAGTARDRELARDASLIVAHASAVRGDTARARELLDRYATALDAPAGPVSELASYPADAALWSDRPDLVEDVLIGPIQAAREAGDVATLIYPLTVRARLRLWRGELRAAETDAREAVRLATDSAQTGLRALALSVLAQALAATGPAADCRAAAERAIALGEPIGAALAIYPRAAIGRVELAAGRPESAIEPLLWCERFVAQAEIGNPEVAGSAPDLVEALATCGQVDAARRTLAQLEEAADRTDSPWARAAAIRCGGLLAADDTAAIVLLEEAAAVSAPLDAARARLALGRRLRSAGDRDAATTELRRSATELRRIGATLWAEQAEGELPSGQRATAAPADPLASLSPLELQISRLAAEGLTNPEIGERLFYSRKTIERHLSTVFAKLGVRSRTELAGMLDDV